MIPIESPDNLRKILLSIKSSRENIAFTNSNLISDLSSWLDDWKRPDYEFRKKAIRQISLNTNWHSKLIEKSLDNTFSVWNKDVLLELNRELYVEANNPNLSHMLKKPKLIGCILSAYVFPPALNTMITAIFLSSAICWKVSSNDNGFLEILVSSWVSRYPFWERLLASFSWSGGNQILENVFLDQIDAIIVFGSDSTINSLKGRFSYKKPSVWHGHKISIACIRNSGARNYFINNKDLKNLALSFAEDIVLYEQNGCLSLQVIFIEDGGAITLDDLAQIFSDEVFRTISKQLPPPNLSISELSNRLQFLGISKCLGRVWNDDSFAVIEDCQDLFSGIAPKRTIFIKKIEKDDSIYGLRLIENIKKYLGHVSDSVQGVAILADSIEYRFLAEKFIEMNASWICLPGELQKPPALWKGDGYSLISPFIRYSSVMKS